MWVEIARSPCDRRRAAPEITAAACAGGWHSSQSAGGRYLARPGSTPCHSDRCHCHRRCRRPPPAAPPPVSVQVPVLIGLAARQQPAAEPQHGEEEGGTRHQPSRCPPVRLPRPLLPPPLLYFCVEPRPAPCPPPLLRARWSDSCSEPRSSSGERQPSSQAACCLAPGTTEETGQGRGHTGRSWVAAWGPRSSAAEVAQ